MCFILKCLKCVNYGELSGKNHSFILSWSVCRFPAAQGKYEAIGGHWRETSSHSREICCSKLIWIPEFCFPSVDFGCISCWNWILPAVRDMFGGYKQAGWINATESFRESTPLLRGSAGRCFAALAESSVLMGVSVPFLERLLWAYSYCLPHGCGAGTGGANRHTGASTWTLQAPPPVTAVSALQEAKIVSCNQRKDLKSHDPVSPNRQYGATTDHRNIVSLPYFILNAS